MKKSILIIVLLFTILQAIAQKGETKEPIKNNANHPSFGNYLSHDAVVLANKMIKKISNCETISHLSEQKWGNIGDITDYTLDKGQCIFKLQPTDTITGSYYCFRPIGYSLQYNGTTQSTINWNDSTTVITDLKKYPDERRHVTTKMLYTNSVMEIYNLLKNAIRETPSKISLLADTLINDVQYKHILLSVRDTVINQKRNYFHRKIAIDINTYLPVHSITISQSIYGIQLIECNLFDYRINDPLITDEMFNGKAPDYMKIAEFAPLRNREVIPLKANNLAPDWELPIVKGGTMSMAELKGKVVLLEFSGVHCGFCLVAVPILNEIYAKFNPLGLSLVSVYSDEVLEKLKKYQERYKIKYNLIYNGKEQQKTQKILDKYGATGIPHFVLINKMGMISKVWVGYEPNIGNEISREISKLIY